MTMLSYDCMCYALKELLGFVILQYWSGRIRDLGFPFGLKYARKYFLSVVGNWAHETWNQRKKRTKRNNGTSDFFFMQYMYRELRTFSYVRSTHVIRNERLESIIWKGCVPFEIYEYWHTYYDSNVLAQQLKGNFEKVHYAAARFNYQAVDCLLFEMLLDKWWWVCLSVI